MPSGSDKAEWRRWARGIPVDLPAISRAVTGHLDEWIAEGAVVLSYAAMPSEIDVSLPRRRRTLLLTRTPEKGGLTVHRADSPLEDHPFGFSQPVASAPVWEGPIDVVLVPGLAFSPRGGRLGKGAGHYDRFLGTGQAVVRAGVAADALVVEGLPTESHDVAMTHLATESGVEEVGST